MAGRINAGRICVRVEETVWNSLKWGGAEKWGGDTKILERREGQLGQGADTLKRRGAGTQLRTMAVSNAFLPETTTFKKDSLN